MSLTDALGGVRGLLLDLDGVLVMRGAALPGAVEAIAAIEGRGLPYRVMTNTSAMSRATLAAADAARTPWRTRWPRSWPRWGDDGR